MTLARYRCGVCREWITYSPELCGHDGPIPLHFLTHHSNQDRVHSPVLTTGLMAEKGAVMSAPQKSVPMTLTPEQACAVASARLLRDVGLHEIAEKLTTDLILSDLFMDGPIVPALGAILGMAS